MHSQTNRLPAALAMLALCLPAQAQDNTSAEDAALLSELLSLVEDSTEIATATRMNVDYVPGMVTVLQAAEMEALGARTVLDALAAVPGILSYRGFQGEPFLLVRGIGFPFASGNVKVLVDSIAITRESSGQSNATLHMPLEQVERIEIMRGPGSTLYGDFAFMGLINIITRQQGGRSWLRGEADGNAAAGLHQGFGSGGAGPQGWLNLSAHYQDRPERPGDRAGHLSGEYLTAGLNWAGLALQLAGTGRDQRLANGNRATERSAAADLRWTAGLSPDWSSQWYARYGINRFEQGATLFDGDGLELGTELSGRLGRAHEIVLRASHSDTAVDRGEQTPQAPPGSDRPAPPQTLIRDAKRRFWGLGLQDQIALGRQLTATLGLRYDRREDIDEERLTPRAALVWRASDQHILKAQYAEAFRAPTFFELYTAGGQSDLELETIATSELSYIWRQPQRSLRLTLFYSRIEDMIFIVDGDFANRAQGRSQGAELEWLQQLSATLRWQANLSFADSSTSRNAAGEQRDESIAAPWLGNLALHWRPLQRMDFGLHWHHVGDRHTQRPGVAAENRLSLSLGYEQAWGTQGLQLRLSARNLLQQEEYTLLNLPTGEQLRIFDDEILSLQLSWTWE